jgi:hypothetical protein
VGILEGRSTARRRDAGLIRASVLPFDADPDVFRISAAGGYSGYTGGWPPK